MGQIQVPPRLPVGATQKTKEPVVAKEGIYYRVSSWKQKEDLQRQLDIQQDQFPNHTMSGDICSGLQYKRHGLMRLLESVQGELVQVLPVGTPYTEASGVEIQGTKPEAERIEPYPTPPEQASVGTNYSALPKAKDVIKDFQYRVSHDLLGRDAARYHHRSYRVPALLGGDRDPRFAPLSSVEFRYSLSGASLDALELCSPLCTRTRHSYGDWRHPHPSSVVIMALYILTWEQCDLSWWRATRIPSSRIVTYRLLATFFSGSLTTGCLHTTYPVSFSRTPRIHSSWIQVETSVVCGCRIQYDVVEFLLNGYRIPNCYPHV